MSETVVHQTEEILNDEGPYILKRIVRTIEVHEMNHNYPHAELCACGHPYSRHFDPYEGFAPVGCKYCTCYAFKQVES